MKLACHLDQPSSKDYSFDAIRYSLPQMGQQEGFYEIPCTTPLSNQGNIGSCVANATADAFELLMQKPDQISRLWIYWLARAYHEATSVDDGTSIRYAFDALARYGACPEDVWEYDTSKVFYQPPILAYTIASANKLTGYYRIGSVGDDRADDIETAVRANHPVVFGTEVSRAFTQCFNVEQVDTGNGWKYPKGDIVGRHAMVVVGVRKSNGRRQFKIRNSWGEGFGLGGYVWFEEEYLTDPGTVDIWVPTLMVPIKR